MRNTFIFGVLSMVCTSIQAVEILTGTLVKQAETENEALQGAPKDVNNNLERVKVI